MTDSPTTDEVRARAYRVMAEEPTQKEVDMCESIFRLCDKVDKLEETWMTARADLWAKHAHLIAGK